MTLALFCLHQAADFAVAHVSHWNPAFQPSDLRPLTGLLLPHDLQRNVRYCAFAIFPLLRSVVSR